MPCVRGSIADEIGLLPGDRVVSIGGRTLRDAVDFQFFAAEDVIELEVVRGDEATVYEIEKEPDEDLGIDFQDAAFDGVRMCNNNCFFCFLKGNPKGMRKTLYVKDDDYRLCFFHGNFVTLTNLDDDDWARLEEQRLSPLNVSVHATDLELRRYLLGNKTAPDIVRAAAAARRDRHRGEHAGRAVPGRQRRRGARPHDRRPRGAVPDGADDLGRAGRRDDDGGGAHRAWRARRRDRRLHAGVRARRDRAGRAVPAAIPARARRDAGVPRRRVLPRRGRRSRRRRAHYDGFPQYENGIGMTRSLIEDWRRRAEASLRCG